MPIIKVTVSRDFRPLVIFEYRLEFAEIFDYEIAEFVASSDNDNADPKKSLNQPK
jgi:hypothetical protein